MLTCGKDKLRPRSRTIVSPSSTRKYEGLLEMPSMGAGANTAYHRPFGAR